MTISDFDEAVEFVFRSIRDDIARGIYEGAGTLDSFTVLHDYCDANDYIIAAAEQFCSIPNGADETEMFSSIRWQAWCDEVADHVDNLLYQWPLEVN